MSSVNFWTEMAMATRERLKNIEDDIADTKARLSNALMRDDATSAETWRLYLELRKTHLESAQEDLTREVEYEQLGDALMFDVEAHTQAKNAD